MAASSRTRERFQFGALIVLCLTSSRVLGLKCYCEQYVDGISSPVNAACAQNKTCHISDPSIGQCFAEQKIHEGTHYVVTYGCYEILSSVISAEHFLKDVCNTTTDGSLITRCCTQGNHCNQDIRFVGHSPTSPSSTDPSDESTAAPESMDWTTGTVVTASLFVLTLVATLAIFSAIYIILRRRASSTTLHTIHRVHVV